MKALVILVLALAGCGPSAYDLPPTYPGNTPANQQCIRVSLANGGDPLRQCPGAVLPADAGVEAGSP